MSSQPSIEISKDMLIRLRHGVFDTQSDGVIYGISWDQRCSMIKGYRMRPSDSVSWESYVDRELCRHGSHHEHSQQALGWFAVETPPYLVPFKPISTMFAVPHISLLL